jgi:hypothetical protein
VNTLRAVMLETGEAILHPREFLEWREDTVADHRRALARDAAAAIPLLLCMLLVASLAPRSSGGGAAPAWAFPLFVGATLPLAGLALLAVGRLVGGRSRLGELAAAWGQSYWATDLFLAILAASHWLPTALGISPADSPLWAIVIAMTLYVCAALWKSLYALAVLRYAMGLRGLRLLASILLLGALALAFAFLSAIAFGTKVPIF